MTQTFESRPVSRTCIYVAAGRAVGARDPDASVRNPDHLAAALLGDAARDVLEHPIVDALSLDYDEAMANVEVVAAVRMMMVRTRFIDDAVARAVARGLTQVVVLGAGLDSHAYRCAELAGVRVFEVDRPATQAWKRERVDAVLGGPPPNLTYVPIDFQHDDPGAVLGRHGYALTQPTFFIFEGVTMYISEDAVRRTLRFVASHPKGSGIVFDFVYQAMVDALARAREDTTMPAAARAGLQRFLDLTRDEPWVFGLPVSGEREFLAECGLELQQLCAVGSEESAARYLTRADGTQVGAEAIAALRARIAARAREAANGGEPVPPPPSPERIREQQRVMGYQIAEAIV